MSDLDRQLDEGSLGAEDRGLAALLDAATAPGSPQELSGERAAVAGFVALRRSTEQTPTPIKKSRVLARAATTKVAAAVAVLAVGGTAVAAETGSLPAPAQHHAHRLFSGLGVPPPPTSPVPAAPSRSTEPPTARPSPSPSQAVSSGAGTPPPSGPATGEPGALALCREWQASSDKKDGKPMAAESRSRLITLAGENKAKIARFCAPLLAEPTTVPTPAAPAPTSPSPSGNGNSNGNGNGPKKSKEPKESKDPKAAATEGPAATTPMPQ